MMRTYLAAVYSRHPEMRVVAAALQDFGFTVRAEWITGKHDGMSDVDAATIDLEEVAAADVVISFTGKTPNGRNRGGRHVEFGAALVLGKRCIVIGEREHVFHSHPLVEWYPDFATFLRSLR